jgi:superfamily II DNA or RNA helicase
MSSRTTATHAPPDPGQLVEVRQRRFVVTDVLQSELPPHPASGRSERPQHFVTLSSVEDDGYGEELQVVWELEPGARAFERMALPEPSGFDDPARLDAFLDAVRWGAVSSADHRSLQSPFRSGIHIEDYQLDPVVRALQMPRVNLLVADDVGLGKTIEAGLVAQELILRHRARTVLVVCPASLQIQWRDQMREKFGLEFRIVDSDLMRELRRRRGLHVNPWTHFPRLITSIDFLKRERPMRLFREVLPPEGEPAFPRRFDLLIVDEAHNVAPAGTGRYATDSLRTLAIRTLAPHFEHKLFLSATPHNGYPESFSALLELLDNQRFARGVRPDRDQLGAVMVRRLKRELPPDWTGKSRFPERKLVPLEVEYTAAERRTHQALREYTGLRGKGAADDVERYATEFVLKLLKKRLFSSPAAFLATLEQHQRSLQTARRRGASGTPRPTAGILRRMVEEVEEEFADDERYEESTTEAVEAASRLFREPGTEERRLLEELQEYAGDAATRPDAKAEALIRWLTETLKPDGKWNNERVLIFTEYRATQKWLQGLLAAHGLAGGERLLTLYGGMKTEDREEIKAAFQASPELSEVRILLATDAASEGIDLQNHCHRLIHYEVPWSPIRLEQRNGRLDRHGQRAPEVRVYHFVGKGYDERRPNPALAPGELEGDLEFLMRVALKVENIREDLGKVGPVIAQQVEEAMLGKRRHLDTARAERDSEPVRRMLRFERDLREQIARLHEQLQETRRELRLSPENIQAVVSIGLELAGQPPLRPAEVPGLWPSPDGGRRTCPVLHLPEFRGSWADCSIGLRHPHTGELRPVVFDHDLANGRDDVVLVHLNHRLVQMCLRLLRSEVWSAGDRQRLHRVAARVVPNPALDTPAVVAYARLVVLGGDNHRLHEEVITAGGFIRQGRFNRMNVGEVERALGSVIPGQVSETTKEQLAALWLDLSGPLVQAQQARMRDRTASLQKFLEERANKEAADMTLIMRELERSIRAELAEPEQLEMQFWSETERGQYERNLDSLRARLERIPREIEEETAAIRARYADPSPRLFPVAVTFLVPQRLTG